MVNVSTYLPTTVVSPGSPAYFEVVSEGRIGQRVLEMMVLLEVIISGGRVHVIHFDRQLPGTELVCFVKIFLDTLAYFFHVRDGLHSETIKSIYQR